MYITVLLCSLIIKSGWYVILLFIIIDLSPEPDINLPSFKTDKQNIESVWLFNIWIGFFNEILKLSILIRL